MGVGKSIGALYVRLTADTAEMQRKLADVEKKLSRFSRDANKFGAKLQSAGRTMTVGFTAPIVAAGAAAYKFSQEFENAMLEVATISKDVSSNIEDFKQGVLDLTTEISVKATDAASALYQIVSAGHDGADGMKVLEVAAKAAVGGVTDTATAADAITTLLNAYNLSADDAESVSDKLFTTVKLGKTTMGELGENISQVVPLASSLGIEMDEVLAAVATLTKSGVPTSQAMTQIRAGIVAATEVLGDGYWATNSLQQGFAQVATMSNNLATEIKDLVGTTEAMNAILGTTGAKAQSAALDLVTLSNSAGAAEAAFEKMSEGSRAQITLLGNTINAKLAEVGDTLTLMAGEVARFINDGLKKLNPEILNFALGMTGVLAAIGPVSVALGSLIRLMPLMMGGLTALISPIGLVIGALAALAAAYVYAKVKKQQMIDDMVENDSLEDLQAQRDALATEIELAKRQSTGINFSGTAVGVSSGDKQTLFNLKELEEKYDNVSKAIELKEEAQRREAAAAKEVAAATENANRAQEEVNHLTEESLILLEEMQRLRGEEAASQAAFQAAGNNIGLKVGPNIKILDEPQGDMFAGLTDSLAAGAARFPSAMSNVSAAMAAEQEEFIKKVVTFNEQLNQQIQGVMSNTANAIGEGIGGMLTGDMGLKDVMANIQSIIGNFIKTIGQLLIQTGTATKAFHTAMESIIASPAAAIILGVGLVAGGTAIVNNANKKANLAANEIALAKGGLAFGETYAKIGDNPNAAFDPEVVSPLSKLQSMIGEAGGNDMNIELSGDFRLKNNDLLLAISKGNYKSSVIRRG